MRLFTRLFGLGQKRETLKDLNSVDWILQTPYSSAAYARFRGSSGKEVTCFIIHEDANHVQRLPKQVSIDVRATLIERSAVGLVVVMLRIEGEIYETYWNFHRLELRRCFQDMSTQEELLVSFLVDSMEPARTIWIPNPLQSGFGPLMEALAVMPPWTMEEFNKAKEELSLEYPTVQALWDGMVEEQR
jgi:hypothetical protein